MSRMTDAGPVIGDDYRKKIVIANPDDEWIGNRFVLWFGDCGWTRLLVHARSLDEAADVAADWLAEHAPGLLATDEVNEAYGSHLVEGMSEEEAQTASEEGFSPLGGNCGEWIRTDGWGFVCENPSRAELFALAGVEPKAKKGGEKRRQAA
jgi:hypothetical protein